MTAPHDPWADVAAARVPAAGLAALAPVRCRPGVAVHPLGEIAWVTFPAGDADVLRELRPVAGAEFFARRGPDWFPLRGRLPTADRPPDASGVPLDRAVFPAPVTPALPPESLAPPVRLTVVRGGGPKPATAVRCAVAALARWADAAPTAELAAVRAARCGGRALLVGPRLPAVAGGERFWGERVLVPVGFRPEPDLPADVLRAACGIGADDLLVLDAAGTEAVPDAALRPLTRAGVRLALERFSPLPALRERGRG